MDSKAPRLALAGRIFGVLIIIGSITVWKFNLPIHILSANQERMAIYAGLAIAIICFIVGYWGSRERKITELNTGLSVEEQFQSLESSPTQVRSISTQQDEYGYETVSSQTQNIIESIIGQETENNPILVNAAIESLSKGEFGLSSAAQASANPAPHQHAGKIRESVLIVPDEENIHKRQLVGNIALPHQSTPSIPDLSWMEKGSTFATEVAIEEIPLPTIEEQPEKANTDIFDLPDIPDLPDLSELESLLMPEIKKETSTPELPNLDSLF